MANTRINMGSVAIASLTAGPLFLLGLALGALSDNPGVAVPVPAGDNLLLVATGTLMALLAAMTIGSVIACLPNMIGTALMIRLSTMNDGFRLPVMWAMVGGVAGGMATLPFGAVGTGSPIGMIATAFTGTCCALICRRGIAWEPGVIAPLPNARAPAICTRHDS